MNRRQIKQAIANGETTSVETAWMESLEGGLRSDEAREVLSALVEAGHGELAETLATLGLEEVRERLSDVEALELAGQMLLAVPESDELRDAVAELYEKVHAGDPHFRMIFDAAGLLAGQSPRRALRTLEMCLALEEGTYLGNRFDARVIRITGFDEVSGEFEFADPSGRPGALEPKLLADEFEILAPDDFRVLRLQDPAQLEEAFRSDPHRILVGMCMSRGGQITSDQLKEAVVGQFVPAEQWSRWWSRARTAAKRSTQLAVEGRSPVTITYHPGGRSLEQQFSAALEKARTVDDFLTVMRDYAREAARRGDPIDEAFAGRITAALAHRVESLMRHRPSEALAGVLALAECGELGAPVPEGAPAPAELVGRLKRPAAAIAELSDDDLFARSLAALEVREDAGEQLEKLLLLAGLARIDAVVDLLEKLDRIQAIAVAAEQALSEPTRYVDLCCWLWNAPPKRSRISISRLDLLGRLLKAVFDLEHDHDLDRAYRRDAQQTIRSALSARDYASYQQALDEMDSGTAAVMKRRIDRTDGLAQSVHDEMLNRLRQSFPRLFLKARIDPWLDESVIYTSKQGLERRKEELRVLTEVAMPANAKQIGEAAEIGDLRENADWQAAIEERDMLVARARKINEDLAKARVIQPSDVPTSSVGVGSRVLVKRSDTGEEIEMTFLGPWDSDLESHVYPYTTGLAQSLMGAAVGDEVEVPLSDGRVRCRVESVESGV